MKARGGAPTTESSDVIPAGQGSRALAGQTQYNAAEAVPGYRGGIHGNLRNMVTNSDRFGTILAEGDLLELPGLPKRKGRRLEDPAGLRDRPPAGQPECRLPRAGNQSAELQEGRRNHPAGRAGPDRAPHRRNDLLRAKHTGDPV